MTDWFDAVKPRDRSVLVVRPFACVCEEPVTDADLGLPSDDEELCWRCHRPIVEDDLDG